MGEIISSLLEYFMENVIFVICHKENNKRTYYDWSSANMT